MRKLQDSCDTEGGVDIAPKRIECNTIQHLKEHFRIFKKGPELAEIASLDSPGDADMATLAPELRAFGCKGGRPDS